MSEREIIKQSHLQLHPKGQNTHKIEKLICQNVYITKSDLQIHCDPYQNSDGNFHNNRTKDSKKIQNPDNQENLEKKNNKSRSLILNYITKL